MDFKQTVRERVERNVEELVWLSRALHAKPETAFLEVVSAQATAEALEGFDIRFGEDLLSTAFVATRGNGSLNVGICAEYDALPNIGHACGHNVIAAAAVGAANALASVADELDLTVTVLGTPAEEGGGGKVHMLQQGMFDGLHASLMIHAAPIERDAMATLATAQFEITFTGRSAHAAASPQDGINAASAMALAQNGVAMMREHLLATDRVHGIVTDGGDAPNIVPGQTRGRWFVRAHDVDRLQALITKVHDVFRGAALMTGCAVEITQMAPGYTEVRTDDAMASLWRSNAAALGRASTPIQETDGPASTDMGNVSYAVPSIHPLMAIESGGANIHTIDFEAAAASESADRAVLDGAIAMAWTVVDMATDEAMRIRLIEGQYSVKAVPADANGYLQYGYDRTIRFDPKDHR